MKTVDEMNDLRALDQDGLKERVSSLEQELMNLRFRHAAGQLEQTAQLRVLQRRIARAKTVLSETVLSEAVRA